MVKPFIHQTSRDIYIDVEKKKRERDREGDCVACSPMDSSVVFWQGCLFNLSYAQLIDNLKVI